MRVIIPTAILLLAFTAPSLSETCKDDFIRMLTKKFDGESVKIHNITEAVGSDISINDFLMTGTDHYLTKMIVPKSPWVLTYNNTMYTSANEGKSWKKIRTLDTVDNQTNTHNDQLENSRTVKNALCGEEQFADAMHDTVEADYEVLQNLHTENHYKYWINRKSGKVVKATFKVKARGYESFITQTIEYVPDLVLPTP